MSRAALIIGGTGFLGGAIVAVLRKAGWAVTCLGRGNKPALADVPLVVADRATPGAMKAALAGRRFNLVVDCAGFQEPHALDAAETFADTGHLIFVSTDFVYAADHAAIFPLAEGAPKQLDLPYGAGKLACEKVLLESGLPVTILRPPHIIGPGRALGCDPMAMRDMKLLDRMTAGEPVPMLLDGQLLIQPVATDEVGLCIAHIAGRREAFGRIFNCCGPDAVTTLRYHQLIAEAIGQPLKHRSVDAAELQRAHPDRMHMLRHRIYDLSALRQTTGYQPQVRLADAISQTVGWLQSSAR